MSILFDAPVSPEALTHFTRDVPVNSELKLLAEAPVKTVQTNKVNFGRIARRNTTARYRSFDGRVHVTNRTSAELGEVEMIPLSTSTNLGEYERLQIEFARTKGTNDEVLAAAIYDDGTDLTREVHARLEQAWGDVLTDGKLTINEGGLVGFEADFGVPANHLVTAVKPWSDSTALALTDYQNWSDTYKATNGVPAETTIARTATQRAFLRNPEVIAAVHGTQTGKTVAELSATNDYLRSQEMPTWGPTYETNVDIDGVLTPVIPANRLIMRPANFADLGYTCYGLTVTSLELVNSAKADFTFEEAPGIVGVVVKSDGVPFRQFTYVDAVGMPILENPKRLFVAQI